MLEQHPSQQYILTDGYKDIAKSAYSAIKKKKTTVRKALENESPIFTDEARATCPALNTISESNHENMLYILSLALSLTKYKKMEFPLSIVS